MKKIKYLIISLFALVFSISSFSSASDLGDFIDSITLGSWTFNPSWDYNKWAVADFTIPEADSSSDQICIAFFSSDWNHTSPLNLSSCAACLGRSSSVMYNSKYNDLWDLQVFTCWYFVSSRITYRKLWYAFPSEWLTYQYFLLSDFIAWYSWSSSSTDCSQDSNYLQCIEDLNLSRWQVSTLSGDLNTCQSSLQSCQSNQDAGYLQCQDSLTTCQTNLESQTNYSDSLNTQLQECLANNPSEEDCEGSGCEEILKYDWLFSLFRMNGDEMFSIPVANNIFLPEGYKAYVNSWSVAITQIEKTELTFDDEEFDKVNTLYVDFYVHIAVLLFVCLFVFYIKKFFSKIFSWALKEKQW